MLDNGKIIEAGTHTELMMAGGKYADMFKKQAANYV
jgi:ABC-type multidrug transport system fused ATPase/permease subunit